MDLILLRHPPPDIAPGICYGSTDVPVDAMRLDACLQRMQTQLTEILAGVRPVAVHASPLRRANVAAVRLAAQWGLLVRTDARLAEIHFGDWEMQPWQAVVRAELDRWAADPLSSGAPGGESAVQVDARLRQWLDAQRRIAAPTDTHIVIAHAGPIRLLTAHILAMPILACLQWPLVFGGVCRLTIDSEGKGQLVHWNA